MKLVHSSAGTVLLAIATLTLGCSSSDKDSGGGDGDVSVDADGGPGDADDTGTLADDTGEAPEPEDCDGLVSELDPEDASTGWFYRDSLTVTFEEVPEYEAVRFSLVDGDGADVPFTVTWNEVHGLDAYLQADLIGSTIYTLTVGCENEMSATFETDEFGAPLESDLTSLVGNVYELDLPNAEFTEPPAVGALLGSYLSAPLLASVQEATDESLTLLVAQGYWDDDGVPHQDMGTSCYDFPPADFSEAPFFAADTPFINIQYQSGAIEADIPMQDMHLEGTFSPDGSAMGGAWIGGLIDTSSLGPLLDLGDADEPGVICEYISVFGLSCEDCGDGTEYCLYVEAHFDDAPLIEGMVIDPDPLGESAGG